MPPRSVSIGGVALGDPMISARPVVRSGEARYKTWTHNNRARDRDASETKYAVYPCLVVLKSTGLSVQDMV